jgi:uncharacterized protein (TIGR00255 family)
MTGFGAGKATVGNEELSVELRSLNHKFCEVKPRLPRELTALEAAVTKTVKDRLARGSVEVFAKRSSAAMASSAPQVDLALAKEYHRAFQEIAKAIGVPDQVQVSDIATQMGVIRLEERSVNVDNASQALHQALEQAIVALISMREKEGEAIRADLTARLKLIEGLAREIASLAPQSISDYQARLQERVAALSKGVPVDPQRLAQEVAFFAERTDVAEEMTRLSSHLVQFAELIASPEPAGRKMDFLVQEMNREVNTTGSKSQHSEISNRVVAIKAELERIREQVQNVE